MNLKSLLELLASNHSSLTLAGATGPSGKHPQPDLHPHPQFLLSADDREEVEVTRRRKGSGGPRERVQAPSREQRGESGSGDGGRTSGGSGGGSSGGYGEPPSGSQIPIGDIIALLLRLPRPVLIALIILVCCIGSAILFWGGEGTSPLVSEPTAEATLPVLVQMTSAPATTAPQTATSASRAATATPRASFETPATGGPAAGGKWLVMLYQDAKDQVLDNDIFTDLNEAERVGSTDQVRIVAQIDRYRGARTEAQWKSAKRYLVTRDADLRTVHSQLVGDLGQVNMADAATLIDFATWAIKTYPADKYVLIMSDHGMGWPGGWTDPAGPSSAITNRDVPLASAIGNLMYLNDIDKALATIRTRSGVDKFEMIGMDACLMSQIEVAAVLAPHARYAVLSEETEPALGWAYAAFLDPLVANPQMTGADLARLIVKSYIAEDLRILDDQARAELAGRGSSLGGLFGSSVVPSIAQVVKELGSDITLSAIDLQAVPTLMSSVNNLSLVLQDADTKAVSQARSYTQSFTSVFGKSAPASYLDLGHFVMLLNRTSNSSALSTATQQVAAAIKSAVIAEKHGAGKPGATGLAIYFPSSQLYRNAAAGPQSYTAIASRFAADSLWDDFLAYFYTGKRFTRASAGAAVPARGVTLSGPNAGGINVSSITLSARTASAAKPVTLSTDVDGKNVGYVKLFVGFYDNKANAINIADEDYLQSSQTRDLNGIYYPVWPENRFTVKFTWDPVVFAIDDGIKSVPALFAPQTYGAQTAEAVYTVDGIYTPIDGSGARGARLYFRDQLLRQVFTFTGDDPSGAPRQVITKPGDTFTTLDRWVDLDANGKVSSTATQKGGTLTFGDRPFRWKEMDAAAGEYVVGFTVEDLDGNPQQSFARVTVQ